MLEHLEDDELGVGDLQPNGERLEFPYCSSSTGMDYIELQGVGVRLELTGAHEAAERLLSDIMLAVDAACR